MKVVVNTLRSVSVKFGNFWKSLRHQKKKNRTVGSTIETFSDGNAHSPIFDFFWASKRLNLGKCKTWKLYLTCWGISINIFRIFGSQKCSQIAWHSGYETGEIFPRFNPIPTPHELKCSWHQDTCINNTINTYTYI